MTGIDCAIYIAKRPVDQLAAFGLSKTGLDMSRDGVALFMKTMRDEMTAAMVLTAVPNVAANSRNILA